MFWSVYASYSWNSHISLGVKNVWACTACPLNGDLAPFVLPFACYTRGRVLSHRCEVTAALRGSPNVAQVLCEYRVNPANDSVTQTLFWRHQWISMAWGFGDRALALTILKHCIFSSDCDSSHVSARIAQWLIPLSNFMFQMSLCLALRPSYLSCCHGYTLKLFSTATLPNRLVG